MKLFLTGLIALLSLSLYGQSKLAEHHFEADDITEVSVSGAFCDVTVDKGDKVIFDGVIEGKGDEGDYVIASIRNGNTVVFKVERKRNRNYGWNDIGVAKLSLKLPEGTTLKVDNSSGDVSISNFKASMLDVGASSGDIVLRNIQAETKARTTSGDIDARGIQGDVAMRSTSGDQDLVEITGNLRTGSTSGDIEISRLIGSLDVACTSGDIELNQIEGTINSSTTSGNTDGELVLLTGDSRFKSTSGNIEIAFKNELDEMSFDLRATSGDIEVGRMGGGDQLMLKRGDLLVTGVSTSGDQTYTN
ncbi:MAG: DUF4097 family beta strand repeat-containing protein [Marinoscillum sp.]